MIPRITAILLTAGAFLFAGNPASAADIVRGKTLHDQSCLKCHDASVYTRPDRRIHSLAALDKQVRRCENALGASWPDDKVTDVVEFLNRNYYKFE